MKKKKNIRKNDTQQDKSLQWVNIVLCIVILGGSLIFPSLFQEFFMSLKLSDKLASILGQIVYILIMFCVYYKDLTKEFKTFISNFKSCFKTGFKYYIAGYLCMIFFNIIITMIFKNISQNEEGVREILFSTPIFALINISILAPLAEELSFRKSVDKVFKNKYLFAISSGLLFGFAHILINIITKTFVLTDIIYILPYASLGFAFALMNRETKSTFTSITMHAIHNTITCLMLLVAHFIGVM